LYFKIVVVKPDNFVFDEGEDTKEELEHSKQFLKVLFRFGKDNVN